MPHKNLHTILLFLCSCFFQIAVAQQNPIQKQQGTYVVKQVNFQIAEILVDPSNGDILLVGKGGAPIVELSGGEDYIITDSGDSKAKPPVLPKKHHVDEQGNVTELGPQAEGGTTTVENTTGVNSKGEAINITAQGVTVTFTQLPTATLPTGFDAYSPSQPQTKDLYKKLGANYYMPYKAVAKGTVEFIVANFKITNDSIKPQDIIFKTKDGVGLKKVDSTSTSYTLKLKGTLSDADIETQALVKQGDKYQIAGAFMQYQIAIKEVVVVLVNTSNANTSAITKKLKAIYQQAAVSLNISVINDFTATLNSLTPDGTIKSGKSGFAAQYTEQQRSINKALKEHGNFNPEAYYLILTDKQPSTAGEKGLMPLGRQFGYIFTANSPPSGAGGITVAHELAHGAFQLKHPFSTHSYKYATGSTNWLLDYNNGEHLPYVHWKAIHNPKLRIGIFDGDGEGEYSFDKLDYVCVPVEYQNRNYAYLDLYGNAIILGAGYVPVAFVGSKTPEAIGRISIIRELSSGDIFYPIRGNNKKYYWKYRNGAFVKDEKGQKIKFDKFEETNQEPRLVYIDAENNVHVNNQATGQVYEAARTCDIRPGNKQEEGNVRCRQMNHDLIVDNSIVREIKTSLLKAIAEINQSKVSKHRTKGQFKHIFSLSDGANSLLPDNEKQWDVLEDKFHLLSHYTDTYFVLGLLRTENNNIYTSTQLREIANKALESVDKSKKIVFVLINGSPFESLFGVSTTVCSETAYIQSNEGLFDENIIRKNGNSLEYLLSIYASIKKPVIVNKYYQYADGILQNYLYQSKDDVRGATFIKTLSFYRSKSFKEAYNKQRACLSARNENLSHCGEHDGNCYLDSNNTYTECIKGVNSFIEQGLTVEIEQGGLANMSLWEKLDINKIAKFREVYMDFDGSNGKSDSPIEIKTQGNYTFRLWKETVEEWTWWSGVEIALDLSPELTDEQFYDFQGIFLFDDVMYGTLDVVGMWPGADTVTDPIGAIYAGLRSDTTNFTIYTASAAVPFFGAAYIKGGLKAGRKIDDLYGIVARKANNTNGFSLERVRLSEINPEDFHLTSVIHSGDRKLINKLDLNDVKNNTNPQLIKSQLDELATVVSKIPSWIDEIPSTILTDAEKTLLKTDINTSNSLSKLFVSTGENAARRGELAESWQLLRKRYEKPQSVSDPLFKKADAVESFADIRKSPAFKALSLSDEVLTSLKGADGLPYSTVVKNLDDFGRNVAGKNIILEDFYKVLSDLKQGKAKSDGANWIVYYLGKHSDDFSGKSLKFEYYTNIGGARFVDVADITNSRRVKYYEFKSVKKVPPGHFNEQFIKDLNNAQSLDDIKWIFNGTKNPPNFKENMLKAIDGLPLNQRLFDKFQVETADELKDLIESQFENIFKLIKQ